MVQTGDERPRIAAVGFSVISDPADATTDLVFVHGLQGHPERTWTHVPAGDDVIKRRHLFSLRKDKEGQSKSKEPSVYWPYDLLAKHPGLSRTRILTYGYDSLVTKFFDANNKQNISMHGNDLMVALEQERKSSDASTRPLVFVAHSLGGILVKVALNNSYRTRQEKYQRLFESTKGVIFLGTPHGGSDIAGWALTVSNLAKLALQDSNQRVIKALSPNNELLHHLSEVFLQLMDSGNFGVHTFYETKPMTGVYGITGMVVPYESARIGDIKHEVLRGLNANHRDICRFTGADDEMYRAVSGAIVDYITEAATPKTPKLTSPSLETDSDEQFSSFRVYSGLTLNQVDVPQPVDEDKKSGVFHLLDTAPQKAASSDESLGNADPELRKPATNNASLATGLENELQAYFSALKISEPLMKRRDSTAAPHPLALAEDSAEWLFESPEFKEWSSKDPTAVLWLVEKVSSENAQVVGRLMQRILNSNARASVFHYLIPPYSASMERMLPATEVLDVTRELVRQIIADEPDRMLYAMHQYPLSIITKPKPHIMNKQDWELRHLINVLFYCLVAAPNSTTFLLVDGHDISFKDTHRFLGQLNSLINSEIEEHPDVVLKVVFASATRFFPQPLSEADKQLASIPYIEKDKELQDCLKSLYTVDFDARPGTILDAEDFTFDWLWEDDTFHQWQTAKDSRLLLIQGKAGSGKSTLAKRILKGIPLPRPRRIHSDTSSEVSTSSEYSDGSSDESSDESSDGSVAHPNRTVARGTDIGSGALGNPTGLESTSEPTSASGHNLNSVAGTSPPATPLLHGSGDDGSLPGRNPQTRQQSGIEDSTLASSSSEILEQELPGDTNTGPESHQYDPEFLLTRETLMGHFFYSFRGGKAETSHQRMLRSVLYQLLRQDHSLYPLFRDHYRQLRDQSGDEHWSLPLLLQILESLGTIDKKITVYIILDAMDESDDENLAQILQAMVQLCSAEGRSIFKALMTTRPLRAKVSGQRMKQLTPLVLALEEKNQQAISRMVDKEIKQIIDDVLQEDESTDVTVFDGIRQYIKDHADGVFLWVSMVLKEVKNLSEEGWTQKNLEELKAILPPELGDVYKRMTRRIADNAGSQALEQSKRILRPMIFSMRRLTIEETRDAIIVPTLSDVPHFEPDPAYFRSRIQLLQRRIPMVCGDLVEVKPPFVQLIHESVREFLLDPRKVAAPLNMNDPVDREEQTIICTRYLRLSLSRSMLEQAGVKISDVSSWGDDDYRTFLRLLDDRPFLDYCLSYLPHHLFTAKSERTRAELHALIEETKDVTPAIYLMDKNIMPVVFSTNTESQRNSAQKFNTKALFMAAGAGFVRAIQPLVTAGADINQFESSSGTSPLMEATVAGHERVVQLLLDLDVETDTRDTSGETALHKAARLGQTAIAELLVKHGAFIPAHNNLREAPIHLGVRFGHLDIVRVLIRRKRMGTDIRDIYGATPLHGAVTNGNLEIASFLLEMGAIHPDADYIGSPLHVAVDKGDIKMAELLLRHGANPYRVGAYGATPLHTAAAEGHEAMVRLLLAMGAKTTVRDRYGWLPINWARQNGHTEVADMLVEATGKSDSDADGQIIGSSVHEVPDTELLFL